MNSMVVACLIPCGISMLGCVATWLIQSRARRRAANAAVTALLRSWFTEAPEVSPQQVDVPKSLKLRDVERWLHQ